MMDDIRAALLGDHEAAQRLTDAGVLVPCPFCGKNEIKTERVNGIPSWGHLGIALVGIHIALQMEAFLRRLSMKPAWPGTPAHRF